MSRISDAFAANKAFVGYVMGGDPSIENTEAFILSMASSGANIIEIGIPFSDPIAEGVVIQRANIRALSVGTTMEMLFDMTLRLRTQIDTPFVFLTYLNPVFRYGYDAFCQKCAKSGVDGVIIPDMPYEEQGEISGYCAKYNVDLIPLVAPTSNDRIRAIAKSAHGFLYMVSSMGVTGERAKITSDLAGMVALAKSASDIPIAVGFGVHTPVQAAEIAQIADGVIVGSAFVSIIEKYGANAAAYVGEYTSAMKRAIANHL
ncbi:MAG: tryptophan synthase subunit alpha [Clostridiales bacterium]|nr:tryptophan synthase subunit alpha [Clostridiales bacterium]